MPAKKKAAARKTAVRTVYVREAAIKLKNFLHLNDSLRMTVWDAIRDVPQMQMRVFIADVFPGVPSFIRFSVGAHGVAVFLFGDDPKVAI